MSWQCMKTNQLNSSKAISVFWISDSHLKRMLKEGVKEFAAESMQDKQKRAKTLAKIDKALKKSPTPAQKQKRKTQLESRAKRIAENDAIIEKALGDKIISEAQAGSLRNRIGSGQKLMPDTGGGKRRTVSGAFISTSDSFKPTENGGPLAITNELGYRAMTSRRQVRSTIPAEDVGIAASKEAVAKLYRRKVLAGNDEEGESANLNNAFLRAAASTRWRRSDRRLVRIGHDSPIWDGKVINRLLVNVPSALEANRGTNKVVVWQTTPKTRWILWS